MRRHFAAIAIACAGVIATLSALRMGLPSPSIVAGGIVLVALIIWLLNNERTTLAPRSRWSQPEMLKHLASQTEAMPDGVMAIDVAAHRVVFNSRFRSMWKLTAAQGELSDPETLFAAMLNQVTNKSAFAAAADTFRATPHAVIDATFETVDGRTFECHASTLLRANGPQDEVLYFFFFRDISDRKTFERKLQLTNTILRTQMEAAQTGVLVVDAAGSILSFNQSVVEMFGLARSDFESGDDTPVLAAFADQVEGKPAFLERVAYLYAHPEETETDQIRMTDGRDIERHTVPLKTPDGGALGRVWFFDDVSENRRKARTLREERDFVNEMIASLPGYFALLDEHGQLVRWNENLRALNELSPEQFLGSDALANVVEGSRTDMRTKLREAMATGTSELEFGIHSKRGVRIIHWTGHKTVLAAKTLVLAIGMDVTDLRAAEANLKLSDERYRTIFDAVNDGILVQDSETGEFLDANPRMSEMFGYTRDELLKLSLDDLSADASPAMSQKVAALRTHAISQPIVFELECKAKDGHGIWCEMSVRPTTFNGRATLISSARDISERRAATDAVAYRDRILHALTVGTAELVKTTSFAAAMPDLLRSVGEEMGVDRVFVIEDTGAIDLVKTVNLTYNWQREGVRVIVPGATAPPPHDAPGAREIDAWLAPLADGFPVVTRIDTASGFIRKVLEAGDIRSMLNVPITVGGTFWGQISVNDTARIRDWTPVEIEALRTFADVIGALLTRERTEVALQKSEVLFRTVSESVIDGIITIGIDDRIRYWNRSAERMFGYSAAEANNQLLHEFITPKRFREEASRAMGIFAATGTGNILGKTREVVAVRKDGTEFDVEMAINAMTVGTERLAVGVVRDITERKRSQANVLWLARNDLLTGLSNRAVFVEALKNAIAQAQRGSRTFAVLYLDLDHFKDVNDTLGHPAGDILLSAVAERLRTSVRSVDTVARFGGDEFAVIALDIRDPQEAGTLADKIVTELGRPFMIGTSELRTGVSIGIAMYGGDSLDAESLLSHADVALYRAKAEGRGGFAFFTRELDRAVRNRVTLGRELRTALAGNQFFLEYQPQVDGRLHQIVGMEALVRWRHPTRGVVPPEDFIAETERSGLISMLGRWILREACGQMQRWLREGIAPPILAINLSAMQFKPQFHLEHDIQKIVGGSGVPADRIEFEITESALMEVSNQQDGLLVRLHDAGYRIAIDDFGNGYSSLDYLRRYRVDRIKIPQNFISDLGTSSQGAPIVRATISLAHELGIIVVAEGVETSDQLELLTAWGCREIQGFYFSKSLSADDATALLRIGTVTPDTERSHALAIR